MLQIYNSYKLELTCKITALLHILNLKGFSLLKNIYSNKTAKNKFSVIEDLLDSDSNKNMK